MRFQPKIRLCALAALCLLALTQAVVAASKPVPIVLDADIGSHIDDAFALALVLKSPEFDLRAVTTVSGDTRPAPASPQKCFESPAGETFRLQRALRGTSWMPRRPAGPTASPAPRSSRKAQST